VADKVSSEPKVQANRFKRVTSSFNVLSGARREPPWVAVDVTGMSKTDVEGAGNIMKLVHRSPEDPKQFTLQYAVKSETKEVALYVVPANTPGAMPVRIYKNSISFHLGNAFEEFPDIRPEAKAEFPISDVTQDEDGIDCVILTLAAGLQTRKTRASSKKKSSSTPAATTPAASAPAASAPAAAAPAASAPAAAAKS
jgi:hypothetical protein